MSSRSSEGARLLRGSETNLSSSERDFLTLSSSGRSSCSLNSLLGIDAVVVNSCFWKARLAIPVLDRKDW